MCSVATSLVCGASLLLTGCRGTPGPALDAAITAQAFYAEVRREQIEGLPDRFTAERLAPWPARALTDAFIHARREQELFVRQSPDGKPPWVEGDLFSSLFEGPSRWTLGPAFISGNQATVPVQLTYQREGQLIIWTDTLVLRKDAGGWKITAIQMGGKWALKAGGQSLLKTLTATL